MGTDVQAQDTSITVEGKGDPQKTKYEGVSHPPEQHDPVEGYNAYQLFGEA